MSLIQWNDRLSVQVESMDAQHKKLIAMINELNDAMKQGKGKDMAGKILDGLVSYTVTHFANEEKLMASAGYPQLAEHKVEHQKLIAQVTDFQKKFKSGNTAITIDLMSFLTKWLTSHIEQVDKRYGAHMIAKGSATAAASTR